MKKKITKNTTESTKATKAITNPFGVGIAHYKQLQAENFANQMIHEAIHNEDMLTITDFLFSKGLYRQQLNTLCEKFPCVAEAKKIAYEAIANRREKEGLRRKLDTQMILASMPMFSEDWKALAEWKAKLTKVEEQKPTVVNVIMEPFNTPTGEETTE